MLKHKQTITIIMSIAIFGIAMCAEKNSFEKAKTLMKKGSYQEALPYLEEELIKSPKSVMDFLYKCVESKDSVFSNSAAELFFLCGESFAKNLPVNESTYYFLTYYACKFPKYAVSLFCGGTNYLINSWAGGKHCVPYSHKFNIYLPVLYGVEVCSLPNPVIFIMNQFGEIFVEKPLENFKKEFSDLRDLVASTAVIEKRNPMLLISCETPVNYVKKFLSWIKSEKCNGVLLHSPGGYYDELVPHGFSRHEILEEGRNDGLGPLRFIPQTGIYLKFVETEILPRETMDNLVTILVNSDGSLGIRCGSGESINLSSKQYRKVSGIVENKIFERDTFLVVLLQATGDALWKNVIAGLNQILASSVTAFDTRNLQVSEVSVILPVNRDVLEIVAHIGEKRRLSPSPYDTLPYDTIAVIPYHKVEVKPKPVYIPKVDYSDSAPKAGIEGKAFVKALVDIDGSICEVNILKSSGNQMLDQSALAAARAAKFSPAKHGDKFVRVWIVIPFNVLFKTE